MIERSRMPLRNVFKSKYNSAARNRERKPCLGLYVPGFWYFHVYDIVQLLRLTVALFSMISLKDHRLSHLCCSSKNTTPGSCSVFDLYAE